MLLDCRAALEQEACFESRTRQHRTSALLSTEKWGSTFETVRLSAAAAGEVGGGEVITPVEWM